MEAIYRGYRYRANVQGYRLVEVICTVPVKSLDAPPHSRVFCYFNYFLHCRIIEKTSKLLNNTWNHVGTHTCWSPVVTISQASLCSQTSDYFVPPRPQYFAPSDCPSVTLFPWVTAASVASTDTAWVGAPHRNSHRLGTRSSGSSLIALINSLYIMLNHPGVLALKQLMKHGTNNLHLRLYFCSV